MGTSKFYRVSRWIAYTGSVGVIFVGLSFPNFGVTEDWSVGEKGLRLLMVVLFGVLLGVKGDIAILLEAEALRREKEKING